MKKLINPVPKPLLIFYFWSGIIATVAYRIIVVLNFYSPLWVSIAWYIGTVGFIIYFYHRYNVGKKRAQLVKDYKLIETVEAIKNINPQRKKALSYLVKTSLTSKAKWNSAIIFFLSVLALIVGITIDFIL